MIARVKRPKSKRKTSARHAAFLAMLPAIRRSAQVAFRKLPPELRHDLIEEVVANSYVAFARLVERGPCRPRFALPVGPLCHYTDSRRAPSGKPLADRRRAVKLRPVSQAVFRRATRPLQ